MHVRGCTCEHTQTDERAVEADVLVRKGVAQIFGHATLSVNVDPIERNTLFKCV